MCWRPIPTRTYSRVESTRNQFETRTGAHLHLHGALYVTEHLPCTAGLATSRSSDTSESCEDVRRRSALIVASSVPRRLRLRLAVSPVSNMIVLSDSLWPLRRYAFDSTSKKQDRLLSSRCFFLSNCYNHNHNMTFVQRRLQYCRAALSRIK